MATPPGKKNSNISQLSGGEKALTALSLVFALFKLNPAPFCMLDEVDAPLDDANVTRFCGLLDELTKIHKNKIYNYYPSRFNNVKNAQTLWSYYGRARSQQTCFCRLTKS